ncbi:TetR/AcrR family transcriptional regulator [Amycolatopsis rhabdoformis]|uniref:TetR/AcrR family transcriptional regulator n=1 Tax=Amycolatopsis rhabdoformis TaxID=1448059 RepID=A0ABZ1I5B5_9PSEU|nr:TetR/AcrR family transcriptional regulator [Amycolatopsis rhabdoformis]WSE29624.1 TetR/AcrR family transcriptional regulator [Amycolatopsis rhabdoformis]
MSTGSVSPRRADTRRNHERILVAAAKALACSGEVSFNAIAKQAEVGVGTVYRHFPTTADLILAVYEREVAQLVDIVPKLLEECPPEQAFRVWATEHLARYLFTKRGLAAALRATSADATLPFHAYTRLLDALDTLLKANVAAGTVRPDITVETVMRAMGGLLLLRPDEDWKAATETLVDFVWRGMRAD